MLHPSHRRKKTFQIAATLRQHITDGILPAGTCLPSEGRLATLHDCGRDTIRDAIAVLVREGHVIKGQGRPTLIRPHPQRQTIDLPPGALVTTRPITMPEAEAMHCDPGVVLFEVHIADAEPILYRGDITQLRATPT